MKSADELASAVVRAWTRVYTGRLAPVVREARRAEIDSDLWEHARAARLAAPDPRSVAGQILARCLLGIGADLSWRAQMVRDRRWVVEGVSMNERVKRNWWILAPIALIGFGAYTTLTHIVGDGFESPWSHTTSGWNPSLPARVGAVALLGFFFVLLPTWALTVRRGHPGWSVAMLLPWILYSMVPLMWSDAGGMLIFPALGIVTLVGVIMNLAQRSVEGGTALSSTDAQRARS